MFVRLYGSLCFNLNTAFLCNSEKRQKTKQVSKFCLLILPPVHTSHFCRVEFATDFCTVIGGRVPSPEGRLGEILARFSIETCLYSCIEWCTRKIKPQQLLWPELWGAKTNGEPIKIRSKCMQLATLRDRAYFLFTRATSKVTSAGNRTVLWSCQGGRRILPSPTAVDE